MTPDKHALPKRLAAKVAAAQAAVTDVRRRIHYSEQPITEDASAIAAYERGPAAYAAMHYPGHAVDSYPVQENLRRRRANVAHHESRRELRIDALGAAEQQLARVEQAVRDEVNRMRPDTPGRVDWPAPLPSPLRRRAPSGGTRIPSWNRSSSGHGRSSVSMTP